MSEIISNYVAPASENPYTKTVAELVAAPGSAFAIVAPTKAPEGSRGSIVGEKAKFQAAARAAGHTARETEREDREDGTTRIVVILRPKVTRKVKDAVEAPTEDAPKATKSK